MLAREAVKIEVGDVGEVGAEAEGVSVEVVCVPAMRMPMSC